MQVREARLENAGCLAALQVRSWRAPTVVCSRRAHALSG